jgi:hypothetical protein
VVPEIQAIDDARFDEFINAPVLKDWRTKLTKVRR